MGKSKDGKSKKKKASDIGVVGKNDDITPDKSREGKCTDFYTIGKELGRGGMSIVYEGIDNSSKTRWAVKVVEKNEIKDDLEVLKREIEIMKKLRHDNVLALREVFEDDSKIYLITELVQGGELFEKIVEVGNYSEADAAMIIRQTITGVKYLHENGVTHRDLKPENLLVGGDNDDQIKIADFGLSKQGASMATSCGTPDYVAPEVLRAEAYTKSVDMWSIGVITYILLCGFPPFYGESQNELFDKILSLDYDFPSPEWDKVSANAKDFIKSLLVKDASERFTATQALEHPWLNEKDSKRPALRSLDSVRKLDDYNKKRKKNRS